MSSITATLQAVMHFKDCADADVIKQKNKVSVVCKCQQNPDSKLWPCYWLLSTFSYILYISHNEIVMLFRWHKQKGSTTDQIHEPEENIRYLSGVLWSYLQKLKSSLGKQ